jgi:hypothetical protein
MTSLALGRSAFNIPGVGDQRLQLMVLENIGGYVEEQINWAFQGLGEIDTMICLRPILRF